MYIRFNYRCSTCGHEEERFIKKEAMDKQPCPQVHNVRHPIFMTRLPAAPRTLFRFNDKKLKG